METALNFVWLGVSLALLVIGSVQVLHAGEDRSRGMAAVAMVCLICLLFPVISMTDDLNSGSLALLEPNKVKRILSPAHLVSIALPLIVPQLLLESRTPFSRLWEIEIFHHPQELAAFHLSRRPPPALA